MNKKLTDYKGIKKGQKFRVIQNTNNHNYPLNKILTFSKDFKSSSTRSYNVAVEVSGNYLKIQDIELLNYTLIDMKKQLMESKKEYENIKKELETKIKFCEDTKTEEFDENTYKVYQTLAVLKETSTDIEKAQAIAKLIQ